jgi:hypothetical protein
MPERGAASPGPATAALSNTGCPEEQHAIRAVGPMIALVKIRLRRPRSVPEKAATIFALYATAGLLAGLAPLLRLPGEGGWP